MSTKVATSLDLGVIYHGLPYGKRMTLKDRKTGVPFNFTGCTARMVLRNGVETLTLTSSDGITLGGSAGTIIINRSVEQVAAITLGGWTLALLITDSLGVEKVWIKGTVRVAEI